MTAGGSKHLAQRHPALDGAPPLALREAAGKRCPAPLGVALSSLPWRENSKQPRQRGNSFISDITLLTWNSLGISQFCFLIFLLLLLLLLFFLIKEHGEKVGDFPQEAVTRQRACLRFSNLGVSFIIEFIDKTLGLEFEMVCM